MSRIISKRYFPYRRQQLLQLVYLVLTAKVQNPSCKKSSTLPLKKKVISISIYFVSAGGWTKIGDQPYGTHHSQVGNPLPVVFQNKINSYHVLAFSLDRSVNPKGSFITFNRFKPFRFLVRFLHLAAARKGTRETTNHPEYSRTAAIDFTAFWLSRKDGRWHFSTLIFWVERLVNSLRSRPFFI